MTLAEIRMGMTVIYQGREHRVHGKAMLPDYRAIVYLSDIDGFVLARDCEPVPDPDNDPGTVKTE